MTINEIQESIISDFAEIGDSFDQYAYLIEISSGHVGLMDEEKTPERLVEGCSSNVWLKMQISDGLFSFEADSDTLIIKGILGLLQKMFSGQSPEAVAECEVSFLKRTEIMETFSSDRRKGIGFVIRTIQSYCRESAKQAD